MRRTYFDIISIFATVVWRFARISGRVIYGGDKLYKLVVIAIIHLVLSEYSTWRERIALKSWKIQYNFFL